MKLRLPTQLLSFQPRLWELRDGYSKARFFKDAAAGATVAIVALPLAMAFAIASGLPPQMGLLTAIVGGFLISSLGGSRVQIGGPAGAFIVVVYGIVERFGVGGLLIATALSGVLLFLMGVFRLGLLIRFIPVAVIVGFTNGIATLILLSQVKDVLGLSIAKMPADFFGMMQALVQASASFNPTALLIGAATLFWIVMWQVVLPKLHVANLRLPKALDGHAQNIQGKLTNVPGSIVALIVAACTVHFLHLPVETIGSRFGGIPSDIFNFQWPDLSWQTARFMLLPAFTLAMLGAIESLLCARVADGMSGDRHNPNQELMAQGIANFLTPLVGGMPATGTIARTVSNISSGATSPVAGMVHALALLLVVTLAAPLAGAIPLASMSAILIFVAWNMGEWRAFAHLRQFRMPYRITLLAVYLLTVVVDLTVAIEVGILAACLTFIYRISNLSRAESVPANAQPWLNSAQVASEEVKAYRLYGALFFGAVKLIEDIAQHLPSKHLVIDVKNIIYMDTSGADAVLTLIADCQKKGVQLTLCGLAHQPLEMAQRAKILEALPAAQFVDSLAEVR